MKSLKREAMRLSSRIRIGFVWPFVVVVLAQAAIAGVSIYTMSAVRAYVGGESHWSKGQKDAIYFLSRYAVTGDTKEFANYQAAFAVPQADHQARIALEQKNPDPERARTGFLDGHNHPDDVSGMIWLFQNFRDIVWLDRAVMRWESGDRELVRLSALATEIRETYRRGPVSRKQIRAWQTSIYSINATIAPLSEAFAETLGEGSRAIARLLLGLNVATGLLLILLAVWRTRRIIEQRASVERALARERRRAAVTLASIDDAVVTTDAVGRIDYLNPAAEKLCGPFSVSPVGSPFTSVFHLIDKQRGVADPSVVARILSGQPANNGSHTHLLKRADGGSITVSVTGTPLRTGDAAAGAVIVLHDRSSEQTYIDQLSWQASHDELTGLANRREFERRLEDSLSQAWEQDRAFALMYIDLDQFKIVNDTCGHAAGDELLRQVSANILKHIRPEDVLARLGGDEFGVLMSKCTPDAAAQIGERIRSALQESSFIWSGRSFAISASIGLVYLGQPGLTLEEALRHADVACYMAKEKGRNRVQVHHGDDSELVRRFGEMAWVQRLHDAIEHDRFMLYAQEILPLAGTLREGAHIEILLRLVDANDNIVVPGVFIPAAERYGLMPAIDRWVVTNAFAALAERSRVPDEPIHTCAINLSGTTFSDPNFAAFVRDQFARYAISPSTICFEITETSAIADLDSAAQFIGEMKALGCRFALDDFGSGMSSFSYLKNLPVDYLKLDGSFVKDMLQDPIDHAMVQMFDRIAKLTGKQTIAEFVESDEIATALRMLGVDYGQGFGLSRPYRFDGRSNTQETPLKIVA